MTSNPAVVQNILERAARAAYALDWPDDRHASWEETAQDMRDRYTAIAQAVLIESADEIERLRAALQAGGRHD